MDQNKEKTAGSISVEAENIFPVIKKWLYSEKEIFLREIVSNACDAVTKLRRLESLGQYDGNGETYRVDVVLDKDEKTITVSDNGIGMTKDEVEKYICSIALSGAVDFMATYEKESSNYGIIGHFGLGFYSAFMVSEKVEVHTSSYLGGEPTLWVCADDGNYTYEEAPERSRGTSVVMHLSDDEGGEFLDEGKLRQILNKYCSFMPVEIFFTEKKEGEERLYESSISEIRPTDINYEDPGGDRRIFDDLGLQIPDRDSPFAHWKKRNEPPVREATVRTYDTEPGKEDEADRKEQVWQYIKQNYIQLLAVILVLGFIIWFLLN